MRQAVDGYAGAAMVLLCAVWGLQQVAIKAAAGDVAPLLQVALRSGISALLVWLFSLWVLRERWLAGAALRGGVLAGLLFAGEFVCVAEALRWTSASHVAVFLYTGPLFAAVGLHLSRPDERLRLRQWMGIALAFVGIVAGFAGQATREIAGDDVLLGDLLALVGGACWGMTTVVIRNSRLSEAPPAQTLFYQLVVAFVLLLPAAWLTGRLQFTPSALAWVSLGFQALVVTFASYLAWFWLLRRYLAAPLGMLSLMTPLFGVGFGALLLGETLAPSFLLGAGLLLAGLLLVTLRRH